VSKSESRRTLRRYIVFQLPEAALVILVLFGLHYWEQISLPILLLLFVGWVIKDVIMYPFVRSAYGPGPAHGTEALLGAQGVVTDDLSPKGSVRVGAEPWSARLVAGHDTLPAGARVRIEDVEGFVLVVTPLEGER
jgi:membrane protein implicated in regulation of membrane protease activity